MSSTGRPFIHEHFLEGEGNSVITLQTALSLQESVTRSDYYYVEVKVVVVKMLLLPLRLVQLSSTKEYGVTTTITTTIEVMGNHQQMKCCCPECHPL